MRRTLASSLAFLLLSVSSIPLPLARAQDFDYAGEHYEGIEDHPQDLAIHGLSSYQAADGSFSYEIERKLWSTFAVVRELLAQGYETDYPLVANALHYLKDIDPHNTQAESYQMFAKTRRGESVAGEVNNLFSKQNPDGGFGMRLGYNSDPISTLAALAALSEFPQNYYTQRQQAADWLLNHSSPQGVSYTSESPPDYFLNTLVLDYLAETGEHQIKERAEVFVRSVAADEEADVDIAQRAYALAVGERWYGTDAFAAAGTADDLLYYQSANGLIFGDPVATVQALLFLPADLRSVPHVSASHSAVQFSPVAVGGLATPVTLDLENTGNADLTISQLTLDGGAVEDFTIATEDCTGQAVSAAASCSVTLNFSPSQEGERKTTLIVFSDDPDAPSLSVELTGTAQERLRLPLRLQRTIDTGSKVYAVAQTSAGVASAGLDGVIRLWDADTGVLKHELFGQVGAVYSLAASGSTLVSGGADGVLRVWDTETGTVTQELSGHTDSINTVLISGDRILSASDDDTVRMWDLASGTLSQTFHHHSANVWALAADASTIVSGSWDETLQVIDVASGDVVHTITVSPDIVTALTLTETEIIAGLDSGGIGIWDRTTGVLRQFLLPADGGQTAHGDWINSLTLANNLLISNSDDVTTRIWDVQTGTLRQTLSEATAAVWSAAIGSGRAFIASADGMVRVWESAENTAPVAEDADPRTVLSGESVTGTVIATDANSDALTYFLTREPKLGTVTLDAATGEYSYVAAVGKYGTDSFRFGASDGSMGSNAAEVSITVEKRIPQIQPSITEQYFGEWSVGTSSDEIQLTLNSMGNVPLRIDAVLLDGPAAADFTLTGAADCQQEWESATACSVSVAFAPQSGGLREAALTVYSNDLSQSMLVIPLTGVGTTALTLTKTGDGQGEITLEAVPAAGSTFDGWTDGCTGGGDCTLELDQDANVTASFTQGDGLLALQSASAAVGVGAVGFLENKGQIENVDVRYYAQIGGGMVYVMGSGEVVYVLREHGTRSMEHGAWNMEQGDSIEAYSIQHTPSSESLAEDSDGRSLRLEASESLSGDSDVGEEDTLDVQSEVAGVILREDVYAGGVSRLFGSATVQGERLVPTAVNYLLGQDEARWVRGVPSYELVDLGEAFAGVRVKLRATGDNVEKLFFVEPQADPGGISVDLTGTQSVTIDAETGELVGMTELGEVRFTAPVAYQLIDGVRRDVAVHYTLDEAAYGFAVGDYDVNYELVIDPLLASTFFTGGWASTLASSDEMVVDAAGNVYVVGTTNGFAADLTGSGYQKTLGGGQDVFVAKFNSDFSQLQALTYLGGSSGDRGEAIALDATGNVVLAGQTYSTNFPVSSGAYQTSHGGNVDAFAAKLDPTLSQFLAGTYYGTGGYGGYEEFYAVAVGIDGQIYIGGKALSNKDIAIIAFDSGLTQILHQNFFGGSDFDRANAITVASDGTVYLTGIAYYNGYASGGYYTGHSGGDGSDLIVMRLDKDLSHMTSTLFGGTGHDYGNAIVVDDTSVYVVGQTKSGNFFQRATQIALGDYRGGYSDGFVVKFSLDLKQVEIGDYIGGSEYDQVQDIELDAAGNLWLLGSTSSPNLPVSAGAYRETLAGGSGGDMFVARMTKTLAMDTLTYIGGSGAENARSLDVSPGGNIVIAANTESADFPQKLTSYQTTHTGGDWALGLARLDAGLTRGPPKILSALAKHTFAANGAASKTFTIFNDGDTDLIINSVQLIGEDTTAFSIADNTCLATLVPNASCAVTVNFTDSGADVRTAALSISSNDPVEPVFNILLTGTTETNVLLTKQGSGSGIFRLTATPAEGSYFVGWEGACSGMDVCEVTPNTHKSVQAIFQAERDAKIVATPTQNHFPDTAIATTNWQQFTLTNAGNENLMIDAISVEGAAVSDFVLINDTCTGATVKPLLACTFRIRFQPSAEALLTAQVVVASNAATQRFLEIPVSGIGTTELSVSKAGDGEGSILFEALPEAGVDFAGWGGACEGTDNCSLELKERQYFSADFEPVGGSPLALFGAVPSTGTVMNSSIPFLKNEGQISNADVVYYAQTFGGVVYVMESGEVVYALMEQGTRSMEQGDSIEAYSIKHTADVVGADLGVTPPSLATLGTSPLDRGAEGSDVVLQTTSEPEEIPLTIFSETFRYEDQSLFGNLFNTKKVQGEEETRTRVNYFIGNDVSKWKRDISAYNVVSLGEVYAGVEVKLRATGTNVEKLFYVQPEADPGLIQVTLDQADDLSISEAGELIVHQGDEETRFTAPVAFQVIDGQRREVDVAYSLNGNSYGFTLGDYDVDYELVIDPLLATVMTGGSSGEWVVDMETDAQGNVYVAGITESPDFPETTGTLRDAPGGSSHYRDGFVLKYDPTLTQLMAATYFGGESNDGVKDVAIHDQSGEVFLCGRTQSDGFPLAETGGYKRSRTDAPYGGSYSPTDGFLISFSPDLDMVRAATYFGGENYDEVEGLKLTNNAVLFSVRSNSRHFDVIIRDRNETSSVVALVNMDLNLQTLHDYALIGGNPYANPSQLSSSFMTLDSSGNVFVVGYADSSRAILKYSSDFERQSLKYFDRNMNIQTIGTDLSGNVYLAGATSYGLPNADQGFQSSRHGTSDAFVAKLDNGLNDFTVSTFLGGDSWEDISDIQIDSAGTIWVAGSTNSENFPVSEQVFQKRINNNSYDGFIAQLSNDLSTLQTATYLGGNSSDKVQALALAPNGTVLASGYTYSTDFPGVAADQTQLAGQNVFVSALTPDLSAGDAQSFVSLTHHSFPSTRVGSTAMKQINITNISENFLEISQITSQGADVAQFVITNDACTDAYLSPTSSCTLDITFTPAHSGLHTAALEIHSDDTETPVRQITLSGSGDSNVTLVKAGAAAGKVRLTAQPKPGSIFAGWTGSCTESGVDACVLTTADHRYVKAKFIQLTDAEIFVDPADQHFPDTIAEQQSEPMVFTVRNVGTSELKVEPVSLVGENADEFTITLDRCSQQTIGIGATCRIEVALAPKSEGAKSAALRIPSNDPDQLITDIPLSGLGQTQITVTKTGTGDGEVVVTAVADEEFSGWTGEGCGGGEECSISLDQDRMISGSFDSAAGLLDLFAVRQEAVAKLESSVLPFLKNEGQISNADVAYYAQMFGGVVYVMGDGSVVYSLSNEEVVGADSGVTPPSLATLGTSPLDRGAGELDVVFQTTSEPEEIAHTVFTETFHQEEQSLFGDVFNTRKVQGEEETRTRVNYFIGNDTSKWKRDIPAYNVISLGEVYDGTEVKLRATGTNVEKLFYVQPEADPNLIQVTLDQADELSISEVGELIVYQGGEETRFTAPVAFQVIDGQRREVDVAYSLNGNSYGFTLGDYDVDYELVIDPLLASTSVGEPTIQVKSVEIDTYGNIYLAGYLHSYAIPITSDAYQGSRKGSNDVFVMKFDSTLEHLIAATYLAGNRYDYLAAMKLDTQGNVVLAGHTSSDDFPMTGDGYQTEHAADNNSYDLFAAILTNDLSELLSATYYGGTKEDRAEDMAFTPAGEIVIVGKGFSLNLPHAGSPCGGNAYWVHPHADALIVKFNSDLSSVLQARYFGNEAYGNVDSFHTIEMSKDGSIYVAGGFPYGGTYSHHCLSLPTSDPLNVQGNGRCVSYLIKLNQYLNPDKAICVNPQDIAIDAQTSDVLIARGNYNGSSYVGYLDRLDSLLSQVKGGIRYDYPSSEISVNSEGDVYVAGSYQYGCPVTGGGYQSRWLGNYDVCLAKLTSDLTEGLSTARIGGGDGDFVRDMIFDADDNIILVGGTNSSNYPTTNGVFSTSGHAFISVLDPDISTDLPSIYAHPATLTFDEVPVGEKTSSPTLLVYKNGGPLQLGDLHLTGDAASDFFLSLDECSGRGWGSQFGSCAYQVTFRPTAVGIRQAFLEIPSNDPYTPVLKIELLGGVDTQLHAVKSGLSSGTVRLQAIPAPGSRFLGWEHPQCTGLGDCEFSTEFNQNVTARFAAKLSPEISIDLPDYIYDDVMIGEEPILYEAPVELNGIQTFTVTNTGRANLSIGSILIRGADAEKFIMKQDECDGAILSAGGACIVKVRFAPPDEGAYSAELVIFSNDPEQPEYVVPLTGVRRGSITAGMPSTITFPVIQSSEEGQILTFQSADYFWVSDLQADPAGFFATLSISDLSFGEFILPAENITIGNQSDGVKTIAGRPASEITTTLEQTNFSLVSAGVPITLIDRPAHSGEAAGKYGVKPVFQLVVPAYQAPGEYTGELSFTLVER